MRLRISSMMDDSGELTARFPLVTRLGYSYDRSEGDEHEVRGAVEELFTLPTEKRNPRTRDLDLMSPLQIAQVMNDEDRRVVAAVRDVLPQVAEAIELATACLKAGGRIIYLGAGTSGRLGMLDASECPPTFGVTENTVVGLIAGGHQALTRAVENAEDNTSLCKLDLERVGLTTHDLVVGLAASGRTPYVVHGLRLARSRGCATVAIACVRESLIGKEALVAIEPDTGAEVLTGSTRLKAGTAQKMILNMISTGSMVGAGKVYQNLMVDVQQSNEKLRVRARYIVGEATGCTEEQAEQALAQAHGHAKTAIVMLLLDVPCTEAADLLRKAGGRVRDAIA